MRNMFFSRDCRAMLIAMPQRLKKKIKTFSAKNVVSHSTYVSSRFAANRSTIYGKKLPTKFSYSNALLAHGLMKNGVSCMHFRVNTTPIHKNRGKFLVFKSSNMIRAGKHTHADAMHNIVHFNRWIHTASDKPYNWHTAMSAPNMVISGSLTDTLPEHVKHHWRATHTSKFPGIAIRTDGTCTPELYASGMFIIPGVTSVESLRHALIAIDEVIHANQ